MAVNPTARRFFVTLSAGFILLCCLWLLQREATNPFQAGGIFSNVPPDCPNIPELNNVLFIVRTSRFQASSRLPAIYDTFLHCVPHSVVYSDYEETIKGRHAYNVLQDFVDVIMENDEDAHHYTLLQKKKSPYPYGFGLYPLSINRRIDSYKFWPMIHRASKHMNAAWYIIVEDDSYLYLPALVKLLKRNNPRQAQFIGKSGCEENSGAATILSRAAMASLAAYYNTGAPMRFFRKCRDTDGCDTAGFVLTEALAGAGIHGDWKWPLLQPESPMDVGYSSGLGDSHLWCSPILGFSKLRREDLYSLWKFEKSRSQQSGSELRFRDLFRKYVLPAFVATWERHTTPTTSTWERPTATATTRDMASIWERHTTTTTTRDMASMCERDCVKQQSCLQWKSAEAVEGGEGDGMHFGGECQLSTFVQSMNSYRYQNGAPMMDRISSLEAQIPPCDLTEDYYSVRPFRLANYSTSALPPSCWSYTHDLEACISSRRSPTFCRAAIEERARKGLPSNEGDEKYY